MFLTNPNDDNGNKRKSLVEIFKEYIDQTNIILKNKNVLFFHEIENLLLDLKHGLDSKNIESFKKIESFVHSNIKQIVMENEFFIRQLEKINFFDLPFNNDNQILNEINSCKAQIYTYQNHIKTINNKNSELDFHLNCFLNKSDSEINSGLKKTIKKLINMEKKNDYLETKQKNLIKQIFLLKEENIKLFV